MKTLILLVLLTSCSTLGTRSMMEDPVCDHDEGIKYVKITKGETLNPRWIQSYHCNNGNVYVREVN